MTVTGVKSSRYHHVDTRQLYVLLTLARTKVQLGTTTQIRGRAMEDVELIRSELRLRGEEP